jgi:hypothetical protein
MNQNIKKFVLTGLIGGGLIAAVLGFAAPAQADSGRYVWIYPGYTQVWVPHVDNTVHS